MARTIGIDIGGTGMKAAIVDVDNGALVSDKIKVGTPEGARPADVAAVVRDLVEQLDPNGSLPIGVCFPAVIVNEVAMSAANVDESWIGTNVGDLFENETGRKVHVVNDADAAGFAEVKFGAAKGVRGLVMVTTLGTGIGSALIYNGTLIPNSELGHINLPGSRWKTAENLAANSARVKRKLSWAKWAERLQVYYGTLEKLFSPQLFVVGGGVSKEYENFLPLLELNTPIIPAQHFNNAGILGAAALAPFSE
ncbi:MAG: polyphosphate--glucose phosphotransferase [Microbacteriaceae bacterium]